jgi:hypothetical protein
MADDEHPTSSSSSSSPPPFTFFSPRSPTTHRDSSGIITHSVDRQSPATTLASSNASTSTSSGGSTRTGGGHERGFVRPSSYLRRRTLSHPMAPTQPVRPIDVEEQNGLVSGRFLRCFLCLYMYSSCQFWRGLWLFSSINDPTCIRLSRLLVRWSFLLTRCLIARNPQFPQSPNELRCSSAEFPSNRLRHSLVRQGELEYPHTKWQGLSFTLHKIIRIDCPP